MMIEVSEYVEKCHKEMSTYAESGETLWQALRRITPLWKASTVRERLRNGLVFVEDVPILKGNMPLVAGSRVTLYSPEYSDARKTFLVREKKTKRSPKTQPPFNILLMDRWIIAVEKPAGLRSVSDAHEQSLTVPKMLKQWLSLRGERESGVWVVHRLDRETSGVLLLARSWEIKQRMIAQWDDVEKIYYAITEEIPETSEGIINRPLRERRDLSVHISYADDARESVTYYRVIKTEMKRALLELCPKTGRKHQLRVHLSSIGTPIVGDPRYGNGIKCRRMGLHASSISFLHPETGERMTVESPLPDDFRSFLSFS